MKYINKHRKNHLKRQHEKNKISRLRRNNESNKEMNYENKMKKQE